MQQFFDLLGPARCALITHVSADGAPYISTVVKASARSGSCADPFHVVAWATEALDKLRRITFQKAQQKSRRPRAPDGRRSDPVTAAAHEVDPVKALTGARLALLKNPEDLTENQQAKLRWITLTDPDLHRVSVEGRSPAGLQAAARPGHRGPDNWIELARTSGIRLFSTLSRKITRHRVSILGAIEHHMSNGRVESVNGKIRLITRSLSDSRLRTP